MARLLKYQTHGAGIARRTGVRILCPNCHSKQVRFRVRQKLFICVRCGQEWDAAGNMVPATRERK